MMLRKKTSFKPNLKLVTSQPTSATDKQTPPASKPSEPVARVETRTGADDNSKQVIKEIPSVSKQQVQEAITQLTGQKLEPIRLVSLRSSANKNVKLKDLLFFNPPMTKDQKRHKKSVHLAKKREQKLAESENPSSDEHDNRIEGEPEVEEPTVVPQVKMGP